MRRFALWAIALGLLTWPLFAHGQTGRRETVTADPSFNGVKASAPLPAHLHVRNEGGSDGAGLCVLSSCLLNGMYAEVPGLSTPGLDERSGKMVPGKGSAFWREGKLQPGGYGPDKLERHVKRTLPGVKYGSYVGTDPAILDGLSRKGIPIGATMNTGELYNWQMIHHMISLAEYRLRGWACVVDNNDPGRFHWMTADEFNRRWIDGGIGWAFWFLKLPRQAASAAIWAWHHAALIIAASLIMLLSAVLALGLVALGRHRRNSHEAPDAQAHVAGRLALRPACPVARLLALA